MTRRPTPRFTPVEINEEDQEFHVFLEGEELVVEYRWPRPRGVALC